MLPSEVKARLSGIAGLPWDQLEAGATAPILPSSCSSGGSAIPTAPPQLDQSTSGSASDLNLERPPLPDDWVAQLAARNRARNYEYKLPAPQTLRRRSMRRLPRPV